MDNQTTSTSSTLDTFEGVINSERAIALLGIATHQYKSKAASCPSDEEFAAFINSRLKSKQRQAMLTHLNNCPKCYHHWLEMASCLKPLPVKQF